MGCWGVVKGEGERGGVRGDGDRERYGERGGYWVGKREAGREEAMEG